MRVAATTALGLEPIVSDEARRLDVTPVDDDLDFRGWQVLDVDGLKQVAELVGRLRTAYRVGPIVAEGRIDPVEPQTDLQALVGGFDLDAWFDASSTFAVRCARRGDQAFTSPQIEQIVGGLIDERVAASVDLEDPDVLVRVQVDPGNRVAIWVDPVGYDALHKRRYRAYDHPAALTAPLACGLLELLDWTAEKRLADPMCGGGTIPTEAAWIAHDVPVTRLRAKELLWRRLPVVRDAGLTGAVPSADDRSADCGHPPIVAGDANADHVGGARGNARRAGIEDCLDLDAGDARKLSDRLDEIDVVATNPPYGIRSGSREGVRRLYGAFLDEVAEVLADGGRIGMVTPREDALEAAADGAGFDVERRLEVRHGRLPVRLFVLG